MIQCGLATGEEHTSEASKMKGLTVSRVYHVHDGWWVGEELRFLQCSLSETFSGFHHAHILQDLHQCLVSKLECSQFHGLLILHPESVAKDDK